jgi:hypothetical protein
LTSNDANDAPFEILEFKFAETSTTFVPAPYTALVITKFSPPEGLETEDDCGVKITVGHPNRWAARSYSKIPPTIRAIVPIIEPAILYDVQLSAPVATLS